MLFSRSTVIATKFPRDFFIHRLRSVCSSRSSILRFPCLWTFRFLLPIVRITQLDKVRRRISRSDYFTRSFAVHVSSFLFTRVSLVSTQSGETCWNFASKSSAHSARDSDAVNVRRYIEILSTKRHVKIR